MMTKTTLLENSSNIVWPIQEDDFPTAEINTEWLSLSFPILREQFWKKSQHVWGWMPFLNLLGNVMYPTKP